MNANAAPFGGCKPLAPTVEGRRSWVVAAVALVMSSIAFGAISSIPVLLKPLSANWGTGATAISFIHTCAMFGAAVGGMALGRFQDRFGFFYIGLAAALSNAVGLVVTARAYTLLPVYVVFGLLIGAVGQGGLFSALTAEVGQWFDQRRPLAIAIVAAGQSVGGLVLPPVLRWGASVVGWREALEIYGWFCLAVLTPCAMVFRRRPPRNRFIRTAEHLNRRSAIAGRRFIQLGLCMSLLNFATFVAVGHLTAFGEEQGFAPASAAGLVSVMLGVALVSRLAVGQICRKVGAFAAILIMASVHAAGVSTLVIVRNYGAALTAASLIGLGFGGYLPAFAIFVREHSEDRQAGRRISEIYFFGFSAGGVGSLAGGVLRDLTGGYSVPFAAAACSAVSALTLLLWLKAKLHGEVSKGTPGPNVRRVR